MTEAKKDFFKSICYTVLGIMPILILGDSNFFLITLLQIVGLLWAGYNLIMTIVNLQFFIDEIFPTKTFDDKAKTRIDKAIILTINILFFLGALLMIFEIKKIDNTINGLKLFWISGLLGIAVSFLLMILIGKFSKTIYNDSTRRSTIILGLPMGFFMLFSGTLNLINRQFADKDISTIKVYLKSKGTDSKERARYLFCIINESEERFDVGRKVYDNVEVGEFIELTTQKGLFGFEVVKSFNKLKPLPK